MSGGQIGQEPRVIEVESPISSGSRPGFDDWRPPAEFDEYRLVRPLGRGSMGQVFLAHDRVLDRPVAIKFISSLHASASERERFLVEARAAARLHHPNIMAIHRVGELDGNPYLVCEFIRGKSLNDLALPVSWQQAHRMAIGLARGLANAHRHGVLHRDIKLANVMVVDGDEVKILDFSLAKLIHGAKKKGARKERPRKERSGAHFAINAPIVEPDEGEAPPSATDATNPALLEDEAAEGPADGAAEPADADAVAGAEAPAPVDPDASPAAGLTPEVRERIEALVQWRDHTVLAASEAPQASQAPAGQGPGWMNDSRRSPSLTQVGALMGTPHYMAPELWHGEPASRASDVYAAGIVLYALCTGRTPYAGLSLTELAAAILEGKYRPVVEAAPSVDPRFAAIVERCLRLSPADRYASGDELRTALELLTPVGRDRQIPTGNPYRGLRAFEAEHRALFFGRSIEIRAVVERLRADPFVLVAGDSGVGKSSLCRAGVVPLIQDGAIEPERMWASVAMMPGRKPLQVLVSVLAGFLDEEEEQLDALVRESVVNFGWHLRKQLGASRGLVIFIDQLEELVTISDRDQAAIVGGVLAQIAAGVPGVRLLASARGDFLTRVAEIPELGEEISRAIYLLRPLTRDGAREAIAGPAELQGVRFESDALVNDLIDAGVEGSLPLLQFALAELWEVRDVDAGVITRGHLESIGGVTGALARHGDGALAALFPQQRLEARRILVRLVTIEDTRANLTADELVGESAEARAALEALVRARLLVIRETADGVIFEIAHEALVHGWGTLRGWLDEEREGRILLHSLETAAGEWERLGKPRDALWGTAALTRVGLVLDEGTLRPRERAFLAASRSAVARGRRLRRAAFVAVPMILAAVYGGVKVQEYRALQARVEAKIADAKAALTDAQREREALGKAREEAFRRFDSRDAEGGEARWEEVVALQPKIDASYKRALQSLEAALILDPGAEEARDLLAQTLHDRALLAEQEHDPKRVEELRERLELYDQSGEYRERWEAPGRLRIRVRPAGTQVTVAQYTRDDKGRYPLGPASPLGGTPLDDVSMAPGSYLLVFRQGDLAVNYPLVVQRGEELEVRFEMPPSGGVPSGYVFIPGGRFLFGSADDETLRRPFYYAVPRHQVTTGPYLIGKNEVTFADWMTYLDELPLTAQADAMPQSEQVTLRRHADGGWEMRFVLGAEEHILRPGQPMIYAARSTSREHDWRRWPVLGISYLQAERYARWLSESRRLPGARICTEWEWERAGRGADARRYPHGDHLASTDGNYDRTYGSADANGPDEIGGEGWAVSPFGVEDLVGNAYEWTSLSLGEGEVGARGGAFFSDPSNVVVYNKSIVPDSFRDSQTGMRICAPVPWP